MTENAPIQSGKDPQTSKHVFISAEEIPALALLDLWHGLKHQELWWTYVHPYDLDAEEPFTRFPDASIWTSLLLWKMRSRTLPKLKEILSSGGRRFADLLDTVQVS